LKRPFNKWFRIVIYTVTMRDNQLVKIPRKQLFKGLPGKAAIKKGQAHIQSYRCLRFKGSFQLEQSITEGVATYCGVALDQIVKDEGSGFPMEEKNL